MGKFGKRNVLSVNPLDYNICILGEPKWGKTTLIKEYLEKLAGINGYIMLEMNGERGTDAIANAVYENVDSWDVYDEIIEDIVDNKVSDYPELKGIAIDTYDGLIKLAEQEAIRLWNSSNPDKRANSIDAAWNGFQKGQAKAFDLMFESFNRLRSVGVSVVIIGHVKNRDLTDIASGETYTTLTSDVEKVYFNLLKKKMHVIGLGYYDRTIKTEKTGKKNVVTHKDITVNRLVGEERRIAFRDDNHAIDCGSRFANIIDDIPCNVDAFIDAITNAIKAEQSKSGTTYEQAKKDQEEAEKEREKQIAEAEEKRKQDKIFEDIMNQIKTYVKNNAKDNMDSVREILKFSKGLGYDNPTAITKLEDAEQVLDYINNIK